MAVTHEAKTDSPARSPAAEAAPQMTEPAAPGRDTAAERPAPRVPGRGDAQGAQEIAASAMAAPATRLPFFDQIQRSFGRHSIANVRARIGGAAGDAAQQLGAQGFAYGEDIVLRDSPDLHTVAHEAAHVIQQRGRASFSGLGAAGDEHEQHAEQIALLVERGESAEALLDEYAPGPEVTSPSAVQLFSGERPFTDYGAITSHPQWLTKAQAYETKLGVYAYQHQTSSDAVGAGLDRMQEVLLQYFQIAANEVEKERQLLRGAFAKDDPSSAGQIGTAASTAAIRAMLATGNLRERMTAFYNAAYYHNAGPSSPALGFKQIAKEILFGGDQNLAPTLGLDQAKMTALAQSNASYLRTGVQWLTSGVDLLGMNVAYNFADDPFALGNLALAREISGTGEIALSQKGRTARSKDEMSRRGKTAQEYAALGMPLSPRELAYARSRSAEVNADPNGAKLPWIPGNAYYQMPESSWVSRVRDQLHMPVIAGVSGTTTRMLSAFQWLNTGVDPLHFRLALIGWMLPIGDHSLYEIQRGAQLAGVSHAEEGDLSDVVRMYMNVAPLDTAELRANAGTDGMFPHEEIYRIKSQGGKDTPDGFLGVDSTNNHPGGGDPAFTEAHATAIYAYTSGMHMIMNAILETRGLPKAAAHYLIHNKLMAVVNYRGRRTYLENKAAAAGPLSPEEQSELDQLQAHEVEEIEIVSSQLPAWLGVLGDHTRSPEQLAAYRKSTIEPWITQHMPRIYDELLAHTNMTIEGLKALPAVAPTVVWRGDWQLKYWGYGVGSTIPINVLRSFSKSEDTAKDFMTDGRFSKKVLLRVQTKQDGSGRDINNLSMYQGEDEVLMIPGAVLGVTQVEDKDDHVLVHCAEQ